MEGRQRMPADEALLRPELVFFDVDAADEHELLAQLAERLVPLGCVTDDWLEKVEARERAYPTGLHTKTIGIAIPHADGCVLRQYIAVVRPRRPVVFQPMAGIGGPVEASLVLNLGVTRDGGQVEVLQRLMNVFMDQDNVDEVMSQTTPEGMVAALSRHFG